MVTKIIRWLLESTKTAFKISLHAELMPPMMVHSRTKNAHQPSTRINSRPTLINIVRAKTTALLTSMILRRSHNTTRPTSQAQKMTKSAINQLLNSSFSTPVSNQVPNKRKRMMRSANKLLSSCLLLSFSSWCSTI